MNSLASLPLDAWIKMNTSAASSAGAAKVGTSLAADGPKALGWDASVAKKIRRIGVGTNVEARSGVVPRPSLGIVAQAPIETRSFQTETETQFRANHPFPSGAHDAPKRSFAYHPLTNVERVDIHHFLQPSRAV